MGALGWNGTGMVMVVVFVEDGVKLLSFKLIQDSSKH
jgi:hypothetical protein